MLFEFVKIMLVFKNHQFSIFY